MTPPAPSRIAYILRSTANTNRVLLDCGHRRKVTRDDLEREQLSLGKKVECDECAKTF
jgi:hypothetical protein